MLETQQNGGLGRLVVGFNDSSGFYERRGAFLLERNLPTLNGVAISDDFGRTWSRPTRLLAAKAGYAERILGEPALASNQSRILYASLALDKDVNGIADRIVVYNSADGVTWDGPEKVAAHYDGETVRTPSISYVGSTAVVAYAAQHGTTLLGIYTTTSEDGGVFWSPQEILPTKHTAVTKPIVRLTSPTSGYIAYTTLGSGTRSVVVSRITRLRVGTSWSVSDVYETTYQIDDRVVARPPSGSSDPGVFWFDEYPISFDVGNINASTGAAKLYLAFRTNTPLRSSVRVAWCQDYFTLAEACGRADAWATQAAISDGRFGQYQPVLAANRFNDDVALSWYEDRGITGTAGTRVFSMFGARATDAAVTLQPTTRLDPRTWAACVAGESPHYYGYFIGSLVFPGFHQATELPAVVTAYVNSSGGCDPTYPAPPPPTFDQHVESSAW